VHALFILLRVIEKGRENFTIAQCQIYEITVHNCCQLTYNV